MSKVTRIKTITEFHRSRRLAEPEHPLISVVNYADVDLSAEQYSRNWVFDFYLIALKRNIGGKIKYGQQTYDFDEGVMFFLAPGQVFSLIKDVQSSQRSGWMLLVHPDFLWNTNLSKTISQYDYFGYAIHEALLLSKKEEQVLWNILQEIREESQANIDKFTQNIIISHIETLLMYSERFYNRQFITRKKAGHKVLERMEELLNAYLNDKKGLPTVAYLADQLHVSSKYLSSLLKALTGLNAQQHIHEKIIEKAKERLSTTDLSVSEIAYELGFEHPQSFSKFFKLKTSLSPLKFRGTFC